jgi:hypothetical protein
MVRFQKTRRKINRLMAFELSKIVLWGRNYDEYIRMFGLSERDLKGTILGCGDGPAGFNAEATRRGTRVVSVDPIYRYTTQQIRNRVQEVRADIMEKTWAHQFQFKWDLFKNPDELESCRIAAMECFLDDFDPGKTEGRYVAGQLPDLPFDDGAFDLTVVSHLLFLYSELMDLEFHLRAIRELLRVSREVRIFPLLDLTITRSTHLDAVVRAFSGQGCARIVKVDYEFQVGGNEMLVIRR